MKSRVRICFSLLTLVALCVAPFLLAVSQPHPFGDGPPEKTLAPQFQVIGADAHQEVLPLKTTQVQANISGVIADVIVEQVYQNTGKTPIEALYVFPASTRAAVHGVEMRIGQRIIKSQVQEKEQARVTYVKAKSEHKTASLLEENRPNVFQMSVANILPGEEVRVRLHYSEKLAPTDRVYEFVFPTVVGPRYSNRGAQAEAWVQNPYLAEGTTNPATFALKVDLHAGMPLQSVTSPSHQGLLKFSGKDTATLDLPPGTDNGDRDFVLRYQMAGQQVASGLLLHQGTEPQDPENFFLLNVQPPARVKPEQIPARDYLFILDVSGSMDGFPMETSKSLMRELLQSLRPEDTFNVLHFATSNAVLSPTPLPATPANIKRALGHVQQQRGSGGTALLPALKRALAIPHLDAASRTLVILTDGYVDIEKEAFQLVRQELHHANVFTFGIGTSVNRWLIEGLAHAGQGEPFVVLSAKEAGPAATRFREYISAPVLTDIEVRYEGFQATAVHPASIPDVFADRPIELIGKWQGEPKGRIVLRGKTGGAPYEASFDVATEAARGTANPALRPLWAKDRVMTLSHEILAGADAATVREVTDLGVKYELLTPYTSFVGVDETPKEVLADAQTVNQPLPLPQGVGQAAAAGNSQVVVAATKQKVGHTSAVPEPGTAGLLLLAAASLLMNRRKVRHQEDRR